MGLNTQHSHFFSLPAEYFTASSLKDIFLNVDHQDIVDFILKKDVRVCH